MHTGGDLSAYLTRSVTDWKEVNENKEQLHLQLWHLGCLNNQRADISSCISQTILRSPAIKKITEINMKNYKI